MGNEEAFDALRLKNELQARVSRELDGLTLDEQLQLIQSEAEKFWSKIPAPPPDDGRKSA